MKKENLLENWLNVPAVLGNPEKEIEGTVQKGFLSSYGESLVVDSTPEGYKGKPKFYFVAEKEPPMRLLTARLNRITGEVCGLELDAPLNRGGSLTFYILKRK